MDLGLLTSAWIRSSVALLTSLAAGGAGVSALPSLLATVVACMSTAGPARPPWPAGQSGTALGAA
eukprot:6298689-Alexandrium_andersonii.AAC.1